jgi:hypothetical protein
LPKAHAPSVRAEALRLARSGVPSTAIGRRLDVHPQTVRGWIRRPEAAVADGTCSKCRGSHEIADELAERYAYLLGAYLGDGHIMRVSGSFLLRVSLDTAYPGIIRAVGDAIEAVCGRRPNERPDHSGKHCVRVASVWRSWPCLFPQHGPGRKHDRPIVLADWQQRIVDDHGKAFLRGLIHSDGWRGLNRVRVKGRDYAYPRYQFSNRSDDIRRLFTDTCDALEIEWRPWGRWHISVAKRESVARMDAFIGPKA